MKRENEKKATIYDLSVRSGYSSSTVASVLSGTWRKRRISEDTAERILKIAAAHNYTMNLQARGLRSSRSGLVAMLVPVHDYRYFSSLAQTFEAEVRRHGQVPVVVSTYRDPEEERRTTEALISYSIDALFIVGASDPDGIHEICKIAGLKHINLDLRGTKASSVVTDNYEGARALTTAVIEQFAENPLRSDELYFFGGRDDDNSRERIRGFLDVKQAVFGGRSSDFVFSTGYSPNKTWEAFHRFYDRHKSLPRALFINSTINLEGFLRFTSDIPADVSANIVIGCFDYDPIASFLPYPVFMIRQDVESMIAKAFEIIEADPAEPEVHLVPPEFVPPRTALKGPLDSIKEIGEE